MFFRNRFTLGVLTGICLSSGVLHAQVVTNSPYIQPGDSGAFGSRIRC